MMEGGGLGRVDLLVAEGCGGMGEDEAWGRRFRVNKELPPPQ